MVRRLAGRRTSSLGRSFTSARLQGQKTEPKVSSGILGLLMSNVSQMYAKSYLNKLAWNKRKQRVIQRNIQSN